MKYYCINCNNSDEFKWFSKKIKTRCSKCNRLVFYNKKLGLRVLRLCFSLVIISIILLLFSLSFLYTYEKIITSVHISLAMIFLEQILEYYIYKRIKRVDFKKNKIDNQLMKLLFGEGK